MTFSTAAQILQAHGHQFRSSQMPGHIQGLVEWTHIGGTKGSDWEDIELTTSAIRAWLGY